MLFFFGRSMFGNGRRSNLRDHPRGQMAERFFAASENIVDVLEATKRVPGHFGWRKAGDYLEWRLRAQCTSWEVVHTNSCFSRRVTSIRWHPVHPEAVAYGCHSGDVVLWNYTKPAEESPKIQGVGMGYGCITEMRFHPRHFNLIYTTSVDGKFCLQDFEGRCSKVCLDTMTVDFWWCCMDYCVDQGLLMVGDNKGSAVVMDMTNHRTIGKLGRLHKGKIKHIEFCPARSWMAVTASVDRTVKFWDVRMLHSSSSSRPIPLSSAEHAGLVSSAYFDPIRGTRLLTTAQNGEIRVYDPHNLWRDPTCVVKHAHRNFQHMTDIRATWHPIHDSMCVVGRYPGKDDPDKARTVDLIDLKTGTECGRFCSPCTSGIIQLNQFSKSGECLASGMGYNGLIWQGEGVGKSGKSTSDLLEVNESLFGSTRKKKRSLSRSKKEKGELKKMKLVVGSISKACKGKKC